MNVQISSALSGCRILALTRYSAAGASSRQRFIQFVPALERVGAIVTVAPFFDDRYIRAFNASGGKRRRGVIRAFARRFKAIARAGAYDLIWIEKEVFPFLPGPFEAIIARTGCAYIVDYDDAIFHNYDRHRRGLVRRLLNSKFNGLLSRAALVTVGNAYLAGYAKAHGAGAVLRIPTVVDPTRYAIAAATPRFETKIVWIGSPSTAAYLTQLTPVLAELAKEHPLRLVVIGATIPVEPGLTIEHHEWSEDTEASLLAGCDIGVMPLPDEPWERGKCGYKLIQYMAAGLATVASPVGVNKEIVTADTGFLATSPAEWRAALRTLIESPAQRRTMGARGRDVIERSFSTGLVEQLLIDCFATLCRRNATYI